MSRCVDADLPRVVFVMYENCQESEEVDRLFASVLGGEIENLSIASNTDLTAESLESALASCCMSLADVVADDEPQQIELISAGRLCYLCVNKTIWLDASLEKRDDLMHHIKATIVCMLDTIVGHVEEGEIQSWPAKDFVRGGSVAEYFGPGLDLPSDWMSTLSRQTLQPLMLEFASLLDGTLEDSLARLLLGAPEDVREQCRELLEARCFRRCLQTALLWRVDEDERNPARETSIVYMPAELKEVVLQQTVVEMQKILDESLPRRRLRIHDDNLASHTSTDITTIQQHRSQSPMVLKEQLTLPPAETPSEPNAPAPVDTPLPDKSLKRSSHKRVLDSSAERSTVESSDSSPKRQRWEDAPLETVRPSRDVLESVAFTKRLKAMLDGDDMTDMVVSKGNTLSSLLRGAPKPILPT